MVELGAIERVDLREVWPHEAQDFTPWLAGNLDKLGEALGLDLELQKQEAPVGPFFLDVLAYDRGNDRPVIIENQLEATNHTHLGQLLTYAAGYNAGVVIWLTGDFQDEHRAALDWLNQRTGEDTEFFGVVMEAWKIDFSRAAPHFKVVAMPNDWQKQTARSKRGNPSERGERYQNFFQEIRDTLEKDNRLIGLGRTQPRNWTDFASGYRGVWYGAAFSSGGRVHVAISIDRGAASLDWNESLFDSLRERKVIIESELAEQLVWDQREGRRAYRMLLRKEGSIYDDPESLEKLRDWMVDRLLAFKRVFTPHLQELVAD